MKVNPIKLLGIWDEGYALDRHTISSIPIGEDVFGHIQFDTTRSEMGELIYQFKYRGKYDSLQDIIELAKPFLNTWQVLKTVNVILPAPSSNKNRAYQPAVEIAREIAAYLKIQFAENVLRKTLTKQSKDMSSEEKQQLKGTIIATKKGVRKFNALIVDDLYQTGLTLNGCVEALRNDIYINKIFVLTMTKTRG